MPRLLSSQMHIAVADPRPKDYRDLTLLAGEHGWHIHFLTTGGAAIQLARRGFSALWMVNINLPDMSGFDLLEMLRDEAVKPRVFAVADQYRAEDERHACCRGADVFVCKDAGQSIDCRPILEALIVEKCAGPPGISESSIARS